MPLVISDDILKQANLTERDARVEFACRLFQGGKLDLWPAAQAAGLSRAQMEGELVSRGIPVYQPTVEDLRADLAAFDERFALTLTPENPKQSRWPSSWARGC